MRIRTVPLLAMLGVALPLGVTLIPAQQVPIPDALPDFTTQSVVCVPGMDGARILAAGSAEISSGPVGGSLTPTGTRVDLKDQTSSVVLSSSTRFAAGSFVSSGNALAWMPCAEARTTGATQFVHPKSADLVLVNDDDVEAAVDLTLFGTNGEIPAVGSRGIALSPRSSKVVPISTLVPDDQPVGVTLQTTTGRVVAVGRSENRGMSNFEMLTPLEKKQLLPAIPAGSTATALTLTNPGDERTKVNVSAFGTQKFALAGAQDIDVEPKTTVTLNLSTAIDGAPVALEVTSESEIIAAARIGGTTDFATSSLGQPLVDGQALAPAGGNFSVTNPSEAQTKVTITSTLGSASPAPTVEVTLAPGQTWTAPASAEGGDVSYKLLASSPVLAAVTFDSPAGSMIVPFTSVASSARPDIALSHDNALR